MFRKYKYVQVPYSTIKLSNNLFDIQVQNNTMCTVNTVQLPV